MNSFTLRQKFNVGLVAVAVVALVLMLGLRLLGKTARFHYLEREHLALVMRVQHDLELVDDGGRRASQVSRRDMLDAVDKARSIAGCVPVELFPVEVAAFKLFGFAPVVELPGQSQAHLARVRAALSADPAPTVSAALAARIREDITWSRQAGDRFGPLVEGATRFVTVTVLLLNLLGIAAVLAVFALIRRSTLGPLQQALRASERIAQGDLSGPALPRSGDEVGQLNAAIDAMKLGLARVVGEVRERSDAVATSVEEVAQGSQDLSSRTENQAATLQQTVASLTAIGESVRHINAQVREADRQAGQAGQVAGEGGRAVAQVVARMDEILAASRRIADINGVVNGIAFQTNILALNAAVEAARAGEHGRGFAVVAGEVRSLASRSAEAAREIASLIGDTTATVEQGADEVGQAGRTIEQVVQAAQGVSQLVTGVAGELSAQEQSLGQIDQAMQQLDASTQQNAAMAEQASAAADSVRAQTGQLVQTVGRFRLPA